MKTIRDFEIQALKKNYLKKLSEYNVSKKKIETDSAELIFALRFLELKTEYEKLEGKEEEKKLLKIIKTPRELIVLLSIFFDIENKYFYNKETNTWFKYQQLYNYVWSPIDELPLQKEIEDFLEEFLPFNIVSNLSNHTSDALLKVLERKLYINLSEKSLNNKNLCVFVDKAYNTHTGEPVENCGPEHFITIYSPVAWQPKIRTEENWNNNLINKWLQKKISKDQLEVFRAICNVVFFSNIDYNLHFFVEFYGEGGTGKSTAVRLMEAIIGKNLVTSSTLKELSTNTFEKAKIANKHLVLCNEQEQFIGDSPFLKAVTGGDLISINRKYKDPYDVRSCAVFVITSNDSLIFTGNASAMMRRKISFFFEDKTDIIDFNTNLIKFDSDGLVSKDSEWHQYLPDFLDWVLALTKEETKSIIIDHLSKTSISPDQYNLTWWLRNHICPFNDAKLLTHSNETNPGLYPQYKEYCEKEGFKPISQTNFNATLPRAFASSFQGYKLKPFKENKHSGFIGLTYQIYLETHFENWRAIWKKEAGEHFFGENTVFNYCGKDIFFYKSDEIKEGIEKLDKQIKDLIRKAPQGIYSLIGNPTKISKTDKEGKIIKQKIEPFNAEYNKEYIRDAANLFNSNDEPLILLNKKEHEKVFLQYLLQTFEANSDVKIPSDDLENLYIKYMLKHKYKPIYTKGNIKNRTIKIWNKNFHHQIIKANNIGPDSLKGIQGLKIKNTADNA